MTCKNGINTHVVYRNGAQFSGTVSAFVVGGGNSVTNLTQTYPQDGRNAGGSGVFGFVRYGYDMTNRILYFMTPQGTWQQIFNASCFSS